MTAQTPMLRQYFQAKAEYPGVLMAIRVGDFYEFYGDDAVTAAQSLEITLTGREDGSNGRIPMAGVPYHAVERYLARLVQAGFKVALCDQVENPKTAKGLVKRAVTRVFTPGTLVEDALLNTSQNRFLSALSQVGETLGLATIDLSTGEFMVTVMSGPRRKNELEQELARLRPAELLVAPDTHDLTLAANQALSMEITEFPPAAAGRAEENLKNHFRVTNLAGFGCADSPAAMVAAWMVLDYAGRNHLNTTHIDQLSTYFTGAFLAMDSSARRALELTQNLGDGSRKLTLLSVIDRTQTPMGSRLMRRWIEEPLISVAAIQERQRGVQEFVENAIARDTLRSILKEVGDMDRMVSRCSTGQASPRDLAEIGKSLSKIPDIAMACETIAMGRIGRLIQELGDHRALAERLRKSLVDNPPVVARDGGVFRAGFDPELDRLRELTQNGRSVIAGLEAAERQKTGISTLKVGFNSVFGYFLEVPKSHSSKVPEHYIRKQTTANAERYITADLKDQESIVLGAGDKAIQLESELFAHLINEVGSHAPQILASSRAIAELDTLCGLAEVAASEGYVRPQVVDEPTIMIEGGRHPVVESQNIAFVPNDLSMPAGGMNLMVLTGPNMSGKSTYLRQNALITLLAQIGSLVPAKSATIGVCDTIFARIGAKDELALGQSTFMVEMLESAYILNHATERSLIVLDEVGRGTSTYDGLAIAWAMIERLAAIGAKTLFATHYHQLNVLEDQIAGIANYRVSVQEVGDEVVWTHKVLKGGTDRSYGLHVARAAGVPTEVVQRAAHILGELEERSSTPTAITPASQKIQLTLFESEEPAVMRRLREVDLNQLTPMQALAFLDELKASTVD